MENKKHMWRIWKERYLSAPDEPTDEIYYNWQAAAERCRVLNGRDGAHIHWARRPHYGKPHIDKDQPERAAR